MKSELIPLKYSYWRFITFFENKWGFLARQLAIVISGMLFGFFSLELTFNVSPFFMVLIICWFLWVFLSEYTCASKEKWLASNCVKETEVKQK